MAVKFLNGIDVVGSMNITANDIPDHSARKITSDTLDAARIPDLSGTYQPVGNYLTSIPSEYLTQTEGDARYLQSLPSHNHDTLYDAIGSADAVQTFVNEQNFATDAVISTAVSNYLPLSGGTLSGNLTVGAVGKTSDTVVRSLADQSYKAGFEAYGNGQGTGYFYAGQSNSYGGGFSYNGDGSPGFISGETADHITFFRRSADTNTEVFHYAYSSDDVYFNGAVVASGSNSNNWNTAYGWGDHASLYDAAGAADVVNLRIDAEVLPAIPTNNNQLTNGAGYYSGTINLGAEDVVFQGSNPGDIVWRDAAGVEVHRIWSGSADHLTYRNDAGVGYPIVHTGLSGYNASNWDTAYGWGDHGAVGYATQTYVNTAVSNLIDSSPAALNTLNELAAALGDDANFSTTVTNSIATKLPLAGGTATGTIAAPSFDATTEVTVGPWAIRHNTGTGRLEFVLS